MTAGGELFERHQRGRGSSHRMLPEHEEEADPAEVSRHTGRDPAASRTARWEMTKRGGGEVRR